MPTAIRSSVSLAAGAALFAAAAGLAACSDGAVGALNVGDPGGPSQTSVGVVLLDGGSAPVTPHVDAGSGLSEAEQAFNALLPDLASACGGACHVGGAGNAPTWLGPPNAYKAIKAYKGIVVRNVAVSSILSKGRHEGPEIVDPLRGKVEAWLQIEARALAEQKLPTTPLFAVDEGANTVDISMAGANVPGVKLTFDAHASGDILTLSHMKVAAPATMGVHVVYPIFVVSPLSGSEVVDTSFSNADQSFAPGAAATLNPGMLILTGWSATDRMRIEFTKLEGATVVGVDGGPGTTGGGCKSVASFTANAVPAIQQNNCLSCHNTGGPGNGALDLSALAASPADDARACDQTLTKVNTQNPAQSDIILAPTGGVANHPFKNASANYAQMMQAWIANEK